MADTREPRWEVKVTSKGQITIPKEARHVLMVREGDHLEATIQDDAMVLKRRDNLSDSEMVRMHAVRSLRNMGIDPEQPHPDLSAASIRKKMPSLSIDLTERIRAQREGRNSR